MDLWLLDLVKKTESGNELCEHLNYIHLTLVENVKLKTYLVQHKRIDFEKSCKKRFNIFILDLRFTKDSKNKNTDNHTNVILVDRYRLTYERFEPSGAGNYKSIDEYLSSDSFKEKIGIKNYEYFPSINVCPQKKLRRTFLEGTCVFYSLRYIEERLRNLLLTRKEVFNLLNNLTYDDMLNYINEFNKKKILVQPYLQVSIQLLLKRKNKSNKHMVNEEYIDFELENKNKKVKLTVDLKELFLLFNKKYVKKVEDLKFLYELFFVISGLYRFTEIDEHYSKNQMTILSEKIFDIKMINKNGHIYIVNNKYYESQKGINFDIGKINLKLCSEKNRYNFATIPVNLILYDDSFLKYSNRNNITLFTLDCVLGSIDYIKFGNKFKEVLSKFNSNADIEFVFN